MRTTLYLIRHTEYENPDHVTPGRLPGFPLSARGREQSLQLAQYFSHKTIDSIYSSPLTRTLETAEIIAKKIGLPVQTDDRLSEVRNIPLFEGKPNKIVDDLAYSGELYTKKYTDLGLERKEDFYQRMDRCLRDIAQKHPGRQSIVVSHGDPMMSVWFGYRSLPFPKTFALGLWYVPKGTGFKIEFTDEGNVMSINIFSPVKM